VYLHDVFVAFLCIDAISENIYNTSHRPYLCVKLCIDLFNDESLFKLLQFNLNLCKVKPMRVVRSD
jgi:hypothetical protein